MIAYCALVTAGWAPPSLVRQAPGPPNIPTNASREVVLGEGTLYSCA